MIRLFALALALSAAAAAASAQDHPPYVRLEASLASAVLHPGDTTEVILRFTPAEDIHLNAEPAVRMAFDSASVLLPAGGVRQVADEGGIVRTSEPLRQRVALAAGTRPGRYSAGGTVTYYFCSDTEGWCQRKVEHVQLQVTAVARQQPGSAQTRRPEPGSD